MKGIKCIRCPYEIDTSIVLGGYLLEVSAKNGHLKRLRDETKESHSLRNSNVDCRIYRQIILVESVLAEAGIAGNKSLELRK